MRTQGNRLLATRVWTKVVDTLMISEADGVDGWEAGLEWNDDRREGCGNRPAEGVKAAVAAGAAASWGWPCRSSQQTRRRTSICSGCKAVHVVRARARFASSASPHRLAVGAV